MIVETCVSLRPKNGNLKLQCPCGRVLEVLTLLRLLSVIESFEGENQALGSFRARGMLPTLRESTNPQKLQLVPVTPRRVAGYALESITEGAFRRLAEGPRQRSDRSVMTPYQHSGV